MLGLRVMRVSACEGTGRLERMNATIRISEINFRVFADALLKDMSKAPSLLETTYVRTFRFLVHAPKEVRKKFLENCLNRAVYYFASSSTIPITL